MTPAEPGDGRSKPAARISMPHAVIRCTCAGRASPSGPSVHLSEAGTVFPPRAWSTQTSTENRIPDA